MQLGDYTVRADGRRIEILRDGVLLGRGRWTGKRIEGFSASLVDRGKLDAKLTEEQLIQVLNQELAKEQAIFEQFEAFLSAEEDSAVPAMHEGFYNEDGVDLREIVWMLGQPPIERLRVTDASFGTRFASTLAIFAKHDVAFMVIGGVAANLQGADFYTKDLDLLYSRSPENIERLMRALEELDALFDDGGTSKVPPNPPGLQWIEKRDALKLVTCRPKLLRTRFGSLDLLGTLSMEDDATNYEDMLGASIAMDMGDYTLRVLRLETIIEVKTKAARNKDKAVLPILRAALAERDKR